MDPEWKPYRPRELARHPGILRTQFTFNQLIDVVKGLMYMHELHLVHGGLKAVGNCLMRPVASDTIIPTGKYPRR